MIDILIWTAVVLVGAELTLVLHELAHSSIVLAFKGRVIGIYPYPHKKNNKFYFARIRYEIEERTTKFQKWFYGIILLRSFVFLLIYLGLSLLWLPLLAVAAMELLDLGNWIQGYLRKSNNDGGKFRRI